MGFNCPECHVVADKKSQLLQHQRSANHWRRFRCDLCDALFTRKTNLDRHMEKHNNVNNVHCLECGKAFTRPDKLQQHLQENHQIGSGARKRTAETENDHVAKRLRKDDDPRQFFTLSKLKEQHMKKFSTTASTYKVNFKDIDVSEDILSTLKILFTAIFSDMTRGSKSKDLVRMTVQSPSLDYPIIIPFLRITELTADRFMSEIERVLQSNEDFVIDESLIFEVTHIDMPFGGAGKRCRYVNTEKFLLDKRCIIRIQNQDDLCCARAIVTAKAKIDGHEEWNDIRLGRIIQGNLAKELHQLADVVPGQCGISEMKNFQKVLVDYQLNVVSKEYFNGITYSGPESEKKIYLYHHDNHYDVITSMSAFLSRGYFCTQCNKGYDHKEQHACNSVCHNCRKVHEKGAKKGQQQDRQKAQVWANILCRV